MDFTYLVNGGQCYDVSFRTDSLFVMITVPTLARVLPKSTDNSFHVSKIIYFHQHV